MVNRIASNPILHSNIGICIIHGTLAIVQGILSLERVPVTLDGKYVKVQSIFYEVKMCL